MLHLFARCQRLWWPSGYGVGLEIQWALPSQDQILPAACVFWQNEIYLYKINDEFSADFAKILDKSPCASVKKKKKRKVSVFNI